MYTRNSNACSTPLRPRPLVTALALAAGSALLKEMEAAGTLGEYLRAALLKTRCPGSGTGTRWSFFE